MINIDKNSTDEMLQLTDSNLLIHNGSYDRISVVLKDKSINWRGFASFSDGFPLMPIHGDSIIIFNKKDIVSRGHDFLKIKYNEDFLYKNEEILAHLMEGKTKEELSKNVLRGVSAQGDRCNLAWGGATENEKKKIYEKLIELKEFKKQLKSNPMRYFLTIFNLEQEIISNTPFDFEFRDVLHVITNSIAIKYGYLPEELMEKAFILDDYCFAEIVEGSPLDLWIVPKINEAMRLGLPVDRGVFLAFQIINAIIIHPEWMCYVKLADNEKGKIPDRWDNVFREMCGFKDERLKISVMSHVFNNYILQGYKLNMDIENALFEEISRALKKQ